MLPRRTTKKHRPFSLNQPTKKTAQVHLNRISSQFKKKLKHGTGPLDIVDSVTSEIGWIGLCILFFCIISICYIVIMVIYSGGSNSDSFDSLHTMHNRRHPDHMKDPHDINTHLSDDGNALGHGLNIDPEHWPHHMSKDDDDDENDINNNNNDIDMKLNEIRNQRRRKERSDPRDRGLDPRDRGIDPRDRRPDMRDFVPDPRKGYGMDGRKPDIDAMRGRFDPRKMEEYLEKKNNKYRDRNRDRDRGRERDRDRDRDVQRERERYRERDRERDRNIDTDIDMDRKRMERERDRRNRGRDRDRNIDRDRDMDRDRATDRDIDIEQDIIESERQRQRDIENSDRDRKRRRSSDIQGNIANDDKITDNLIANNKKSDPIGDTIEYDENINIGDNNDNDLSNWDKVWNSIKAIDINTVEDDSDVNGDNDDYFDTTNEEKAYLIKSSFLHAWHGYAKYALGHDEIHPVSDIPGDSWGGLGATLIDALDTMILMGIKEEYNVARKKLEDIHFDINLQVSFFETTIRHLGGLIGAYELTSIMNTDNGDGDGGGGDQYILSSAVSLINHLLPAFNTQHGIPKSMINLETGEIKNYGWTKDRSVLSEIGSNQLEFTAMSEYTGLPDYYDKSINVYNTLYSAQKISDNDSGLYSRLINTDSGTFSSNEKVYSLGGMSDSFYEYTLKLWILTGYTNKLSIKMYVESINAANERLLRIVSDKNRRKREYYFYGEEWYNKFRGKMEELQCFIPGVLALGSYHILLRKEHSIKYNSPLTDYENELLNSREKHLKLAHVLLESCYRLYSEMPTGLAPESIEFNDNEWNPKEMKYQLRPETLESLFILYSLTGNEIYRKWGWNIAKSIDTYCRTDVAFSGINDVTEIPPKQDNQMQSYVMAETFKYLYLLFDDNAATLLPLNQYVFNTEAHPIKIFDLTQQEWYNNSENTPV